MSTGAAIPDTVRCEQGAIVNLPLVTLSLLLSDYLDGMLNTFQVSGLSVPSYQTFEENDWVFSWEVEKLVEQSVKVQPPGLDFSGQPVPFPLERTLELVTYQAGTP